MPDTPPPPFLDRRSLIVLGAAALGLLAWAWLPVLTAATQPPPEAGIRAQAVAGLLAAGGEVPVVTAGGQAQSLPAASLTLRQIGECRDGGTGFSFRLGGSGEQGARVTAIFHCPVAFAAEGHDRPVRAALELRLRQHRPQPEAGFLSGRDLDRVVADPAP